LNQELFNYTEPLEEPQVFGEESLPEPAFTQFFDDLVATF
jgi:hypothetical protein